MALFLNMNIHVSKNSVSLSAGVGWFGYCDWIWMAFTSFSMKLMKNFPNSNFIDSFFLHNYRVNFISIINLILFSFKIVLGFMILTNFQII